jgi:hypothetical protein
MNIEQITKTFLTYVKDNYNLEDSNLKRKYFHSQNVATNALSIAKSIELDKDNQELAYVIGLLHDFARFEQWKLYNTYKDSKSIDHGNFAVELLINKNKISMFDIPKEYYSIISKSIEQHNKKAISSNVVDEKTLLHCKIIKDADKLDLYKLNMKGKLPTFSNKDGMTLQSYESVFNGKLVDDKCLNTKLDRALLNIATANDLNFEYSVNKVLEMNFFDNMLKTFKKILNEEDTKILIECLDFAKNKATEKVANLKKEKASKYAS